MTASCSTRMDLSLLSFASLLLAAAVGMSYAYVDLSLNRMGISATAIGLNAAMPALGWLLATPLMPWALRSCPPKILLLGLVMVVAISALGFPAFSDTTVWMLLRFLFGGSAGMAFRLVEYWINATANEQHRARSIGVYATAFAFGAMLGATITPMVGIEGWTPALLMSGLSTGAAVVLAVLPGGPPSVTEVTSLADKQLYRGLARIALLGALTFGLFEAVFYTLMPVYTIRLGLAEDWAIWCAAAAMGGQIIMSVMVGWMADRWGKLRVTLVSTALACAIPAITPFVVQTPAILLLVMALWGCLLLALYNVTLAMLGDCFKGSQLASANAAFGTLYALGSLCGPIIHGLAMDAFPLQGLMISSALLLGAFLLFGLLYKRPA